jgi:hypothetical protein
MHSLRGSDMAISSKGNYSIMPHLYYVGVAISLLVTLHSFLRLLKLYLSSEKIVLDRRTAVIHPGIQPFSFLGALFVRSRNEDPIIIHHEMVHIRQNHWIDLVLIEVAAIVLWFNPVIYLYRRSIIIQQEYIADQHTLISVPIEEYLNCITRQLESNLYSRMINGFNTQSIKQRIIMMTNTKKYSAVRYLLVLPLIAVLTLAFTTQKAGKAAAQDQTFRSPVDVAKLKPGEGAGYGKRFNPKTNSEVLHTGVDFVLASGNNVYAVSDGIVVNAATSDTYGKFVTLEHRSGLQTLSAHLENTLVKTGDMVAAGLVIGTVGSTGLSTGPNLHFEVLKNGTAVDPALFLQK